MKIKFVILVWLTIFSSNFLFSQAYLDSLGLIDSNFKIQKYVAEIKNYINLNEIVLKGDSDFLRNDLSIINSHFKTTLFMKLKGASGFKFNKADSITKKINIELFELKFREKEDCKKAFTFFNGRERHSWGEFKIYSNAVIKNDMMLLIVTSQVKNKSLIEFINNY